MLIFLDQYPTEDGLRFKYSDLKIPLRNLNLFLCEQEYSRGSKKLFGFNSNRFTNGTYESDRHRSDEDHVNCTHSEQWYSLILATVLFLLFDRHKSMF